MASNNKLSPKKATALLFILNIFIILDIYSVLGKESIHKQCAAGKIDQVARLIKSGYNANEFCNGQTPLHVASENGYNDIVELLIRHKADIDIENCYNMTPLELAIKKGNEKTFSILISHGADINHISRDGDTPLILAVERSRYSMVEQLIQLGADKKVKDGHMTLNEYAREVQEDAKMEEVLSKNIRQ